MFTNPSRRRRYRPESAEQAWALALAFLDERLGP
jgi:dienelactone hydrolase